MRELSDDECMEIAGSAFLTTTLIRAGYAAGYRAAQAEAGIKPGPLDPIADLCARLRALHIIDEVGSNNPLGRDAAAALERLRAERDTLVAIVRAADSMRHADQVSIDGTSRSGAPWSVYRRLAIAYDAARAKWEGK